MKKASWIVFGAVCCALLIGAGARAGTVEWDFSPATTDDGFAPVTPTLATLGGTVEDWTLDGNPNNYDPSVYAAAIFDDGYLHFIDDANVSGNVSLRTSDNAAVREEYKLQGAGSRLWFVCDHQMITYGSRANLEPGSIDRSRGQLFWISFLTSNGTGLGVQYVAANYNTEDFMYFTAIGNADEGQDDYVMDNRLIEDYADLPNMERRTVYIRVTENDDGASVSVDVKFEGGTYRTIDPAFAGAITNYAAGNEDGDENVLACIGNNSGSGAIEFNMYRLTFTNEDPDGGVNIENWHLFE